MKRTLGTVGSTLLLLVGLVTVAGPAHAAVVACGQTLLVSTVLDNNIGPCDIGVIIGADNITFDLNGHSITAKAGTDEGPGVRVENHTGVTVKNGSVTLFDAGVALVGGSGNTVTGMKLQNNRGSFFTDFGDGIGLYSSNNNRIIGNQVDNNGPYDGIGLLTSSGNLVDSNQITNNNQSSNNTAGIRLENSGRTASNNNTITNNLVVGSGTFGIQVFAGGSNNVIRNNQVVSNALDGITVFAGGNGNIIETNVTRQNGGSGIFIRGAAGSFAAPANNQILRNSSFGNTVFDLRDGTPDCGTNQWHGNQGATGSPPCVFNP